jgi:parallel beta-helix repeat protein
MKKLLIIPLLFFSLILSATNYYVKTGGSDAANGLTDGTAWLTINKVNTSSFNAGDTIFFNRDNVWREMLTFPSSGTANNHIVFSSYGTGVNPIVNGSDLTATWTNHAGDIWIATVTTQPYQVFFDNTRGTKVANHNACTAQFNWYWSGDTLYVYAASDPDALYTAPGIESGARMWCILMNTRSHVTLDGVDACKNNSDYMYHCAIYGYGDNGAHDFLVKNLTASYGITNIGADNCPDFVVENCTVSYGLYTGIYNRSDNSSTGCIIRNNTASYNGYEGIIVAGSTATRLISPQVYGNTCDYNSTGIYCHFVNGASVYQNSCSNGHSAAYEEYGIAFESCSSCLVYENDVHDNHHQGISFYGGAPGGVSINNLVYRNKVYNHTEGAGYGICFGGYVAGQCAGNSIYSNIIYNQNYGFVSDFDIVGGSLYNNTIYGSLTAGVLFQADNPQVTMKNNLITGTVLCMNSNAVTTGLTHTNNLYYRVSGTAVSYNSTNYTMAQIATFEATAVGADPLLVSSENFHLTSVSPAINAGVNVGLTTDYEGNRIPFNLYDIGAYEFYIRMLKDGLGSHYQQVGKTVYIRR